MIISIILTFEGIVIPWQEESMIKMSSSTADFLKDAAPWLSEAQQQDLCEDVIRDNPDLSYVLIIDRDGRAIAHSNPQRVGMYFNDSGSLAAARYGRPVQQTYIRDQDNESSPYHGERIVDILYPLSDKEGNPAGAVNIGLSMARLDTMKGQYRLLITAITVIILVAMLLLSFTFYGYIYRPIDVLVHATRKFRDDREPAAIKARSDDEFAELAGEFNGMSDRISKLIGDLSRREQELQEYVDHLLTFNAKLTTDGTIEIMNRATPRPAGMREGSLIGSRLWDEACWDMPPDARSRLREHLGKAALGEAVSYEETLVHEGSQVILDIGLRPVRAQDGTIAYIVTEIRDVTRQRVAEELLRQSEKKYRAIFENTVTGTIILEDDMTISLANSEFEKLTGFSKEEIEGRMRLMEFLPREVRGQAGENQVLHFKSGEAAALMFEHQLIDKQGLKREVIAKGTMLSDTRQALISLLDITERKRAEDMVKSSLIEKEVLLREIHHRVKNNLQIISSLLSLQSSSIDDKTATRVFQESQNRVRSMALIHEKLYQSKDLSRIDFADYIQSLSQYLFQSYVKDQDRIQLDLQVQKVPLCIDAAIPCGLIINELLTNSLKHAFPGDRRGQVTIGLQVLPDGAIELRVSDNGVGLQGGLDVDSARTLGLQLVNALVSQLEGRLDISTEAGVAFRITFRDPCDGENCCVPANLSGR